MDRKAEADGLLPVDIIVTRICMTATWDGQRLWNKTETSTQSAGQFQGRPLRIACAGIIEYHKDRKAPGLAQNGKAGGCKRF